MKITGGDIEIVKAFEQQRGHNTNLNSYRCLIGDLQTRGIIAQKNCVARRS